MKKKSRRKFRSNLKSKVALEVAKGLKTINEITSRYRLLLNPLLLGQNSISK